MTISEGNLTLTLRPAKPKLHLSVNSFFNSLAENYQECAVGVLLSGNGNDGTVGLRSIKAAGGISFAQHPSARFQGMPKNAIGENAVDLVPSPRKIADELTQLSRQQDIYHAALTELDEDSIADGNEDLQLILRQIHTMTGMDFSHYKINTVKKRIIRRMIIHKKETLKDYVEFIKYHPAEVQQLFHDLLINVTSFFRDEEVTDYLRKTLLPKIISLKSPGEPFASGYRPVQQGRKPIAWPSC